MRTIAESASPNGDVVLQRPLRIPYPNGRIVQSYSLIDRGINPLDFFEPYQNAVRALLGDIRFIGRFDQSGNISKLFFAPEFPSEDYRSVRDYLTYFGIVLSHNAEPECAVYQLWAWDAKYRAVNWTLGVDLVKGHESCLSAYQKAVLQNVLAIDHQLSTAKPNIDRSEMRRLVGSSVGGRLELKSFVKS